MKPKTRTDAAAPEATKKLSEEEKRALEHKEEAEHASGPRKELLIKHASRLAEKRSS